MTGPGAAVSSRADSHRAGPSFSAGAPAALRQLVPGAAGAPGARSGYAAPVSTMRMKQRNRRPRLAEGDTSHGPPGLVAGGQRSAHPAVGIVPARGGAPRCARPRLQRPTWPRHERERQAAWIPLLASWGGGYLSRTVRSHGRGSRLGKPSRINSAMCKSPAPGSGKTPLRGPGGRRGPGPGG